jgi:Tol biopolymer transport system component
MLKFPKAQAAGFLLAVIALGSLNVEAQSGSDAPFLYYYSREQKAFIVERADGSESRVLAEYDLHEGVAPDAITGPGWSPSGKWFAWTKYNLEGGALLESVALLVHRDGGNLVSLAHPPDDSQYASVHLYWSPVEDLLLVQHIWSSGDELFVYDPNRGEVVTRFATTGEYAEWSPDGQYVSVVYSDSATGERVVYVSVFSARDGAALRVSRIEPHGYWESTNWLAASNLSYVETDGELVVEDFSANERLRISLPPGITRFIQWSPDSRHALVYVAQDDEAHVYDVYLASLADQSLDLILPNGIVFPSEQSERYEGFFNIPGIVNTSVWSPSGQRAVIATAEREVWALSVASETIEPLPIPEAYETDYVQWFSNTRVVFLQRDFQELVERVMSYDFESGQLDNILTVRSVHAYPWFLSLSPDEQYMFLGGDGSRIINLETGEAYEQIFFSDYYVERRWDYVEEVLWHPTEKWVFQVNLIPGWLNRLVGVANVDGTVQRELGGCGLSLSCFGWLPELRE